MNALFRLLTTAALTLFAAPALAIGLADLSNKDTVAGMKAALTKGSQAAVEMLAKQDGFLGNERVRIPLPGSLHKVEGLMRGLGMGKYADELVTTMNRAAETAVVEAKPLLVNAVKISSLPDIDVYELSFPAGRHKLDPPGSGAFLVLGVVAEK